MSSITVTIPKGEHTSKSLDRLLLRIRLIFWWSFRRKKLRVHIRFLSDPYDTMGDKDLEEDISKAFGFNLQAWAPSNENSIMAGFRSNYESGKWDITPYANVGGANLPGLREKLIAASVSKDEWFMFEIDPLSRNKFKASLYVDPTGNEGWSHAGSVTHEYPVKTWLGSLIGPWHGGKDDDGNNLGGPAPANVKLEIQWGFV